MADGVIPSWPSNILPFEPERGSYSLTHQDDSVRTSMEVGPKRVRRRFTDTTSLVQMTWDLRDLEFDYFRAFFQDDLQNGALWFDVSIYTGSEYCTKRARFLEPFSARDAGHRRWKVTAKLEVRDLGSVGGGMVWLLNEYGEDFVLNTLFAQADDYINNHYYDAVDPRYT